MGSDKCHQDEKENLILHIEAAKTAVADADFQTVVEMHMIQVGQGNPVVSDKGNGRKIFWQVIRTIVNFRNSDD